MRRERVLVIVALAAAVVAGVVVGAVVFGGDDDGVEASDTTTTTADGGEPDGDDGSGPSGDDGSGGDGGEEISPPTTLDVEAFDGDARELAEALNRASSLTYHALYRALESDIEVEIWRRPPLARRDTRTRDPETDAEIRVQEYRLADGSHIGCLEQDEESLCVHADETDEEAVDPADPVIGAVDPAAGEVRAYDDTVDGTAVRCFDVLGGGDEGEDATACFDGDGIPVVIDGGEDRMERVEDPGRGVPDDVLTPPSQPIEVPEDTPTTEPADPS